MSGDGSAFDSPLLIVEDDLALQKQIKWSLDKFDCVTAADRSEEHTSELQSR